LKGEFMNIEREINMLCDKTDKVGYILRELFDQQTFQGSVIKEIQNHVQYLCTGTHSIRTREPGFKPCPFCGGDDIKWSIVNHLDRNQYSCGSCGKGEPND
jgi:predicted RNA-binding Zn-ribbon protein involved in translation (DUF1610 family)